ncbi:30S ribosome-binding factor RbfA [Balneicella halophila]|nr:30S ribosome-binding factor RbfA [Balneicella halophila]
MESNRQEKISRLLQRELSELFRKDGYVYAPGRMITVSKVNVSPDLGLAKAYLSIFPSQTSEEDLKKIQENTKTIRYNLGKIVGKQLRIVPDLAFYLDDTLDYLENIDSLLKE